LKTFLGTDDQSSTGTGPQAEKATPPVSPAVANVVSLTIQYFLVYLLVHITKSYSQLKLKGGKTSYDKLADSLCKTVHFCPMLSILFVGVRLRALTLNPEGAPPGWAQAWMWICSIAMWCETVLGVLIHFAVGAESKAVGVVALALTAVKFIIIVGIYVGFSTIIGAFFLMDAPPGNANCPTCPFIYTPPVPPAIQCLISLTIQYFTLYLFLNVVHFWNKITRKGFKTPLEKTLEDARESVKFCPILGVIFIGARMRALELDPKGAPQPWAQMMFFVATYCVLAQTILKLFIPFFTGAWNARVDSEGNMLSKSGTAGTGAFLIFLMRYAVLLLLFGSMLGVLWSVVVLEAPHGQITPSISTSMHCVMVFTVIFILMYFLYTIVKTYAELFLDVVGQMTVGERILNAGLPTLDSVPMLCILYVSARMRALQVHPSGMPQLWAQDMMYLGTFGTISQLCVSLVLPFFSGDLEDKALIPLSAQKGGRASATATVLPRASVADTIRSTVIGPRAAPPQPQRPLTFFEQMTKLLIVIKFGILSVVYISTFSVIASIYLIKSK